MQPRYRILDRIGAGGMGIVYRAEDLTLKRLVALKFLREGAAGGSEGRARFLREARTAAALNHPNVCTIHEVGEMGPGTSLHLPAEEPGIPPGTPFIAMEFVEGRPLAVLLKESGPLPLDRILGVAAQAADGLAEAHSRGIVHRDLKPQNIMVTPQGRVKILDFGVAKPAPSPAPADEDRTEARTISADVPAEGRLVGTFAYMSPEQASGTEVDPRSDVFSFGTMLYEMASGTRPFHGETPTATLAKIIETEPRPLGDLRPDLPDDLHRIVRRCLGKRPEERYADARDLAADLARLRGAAASGAAGAAAARRGAPARRAAWIAAAIVLAAAAAALVIGRRAWPARERPSAEEAAGAAVRIAVLPFAFRGGGEHAYLGEGMVDLLTTTLDGAGGLRGVDPHAVLGALEQEGGRPLDPARGREIADRLSAGLFVMGNILEAGGRVRLDAALYDAGHGSEPVAQASAEGAPAAIFDLVEDVAVKLLAGRIEGPAARVTRLAAVSTQSVAALKAYLEGESAFRAGRFVAAAEAFERAVAADPEFALAYYRLSIAGEWLSREDMSRKASEAAMRRADRLSEHDRRLLEAFHAWRRGATDEAERLYRAILGSYPDDVEALFQLGEVVFHGGPIRGRPFVESREIFEKVLAYDQDFIGSLLHLARIAAAEGRRDDLDRLTARISELNPEGDRTVEMKALSAFTYGDEAARRQVVAELTGARDFAAILTGVNVMYSEVLLDADDLLRPLAHPTRSSEVRALGHVLLAHLELAHGRWEAAKAELAAAGALDAAQGIVNRAVLAAAPFLHLGRAELEKIRDEVMRWKAEDVPPAVTPSNFLMVHNGLHHIVKAYLSGLLAARLDRTGDALESAATLERLDAPAASGSMRADLAAGLRAQVEAARSRPREALGHLESIAFETPYQWQFSSPFLSLALERDLRADLLESEGRLEEAVRWHASLVGHAVYDVPYVAPSLLKRARIYERLGDAEAAADHYARFVRLWKDCDPALRPVLEKARERLRQLGGG